MQTCTQCKLEKSFDNFSKDKYRKSGYTANCKKCYNNWRRANMEKELLRHRKYYAENIKKERRRAKKYYIAHKEDCLKRNRKNFILWKETHQEELRERRKKYYFLAQAKKLDKIKRCCVCKIELNRQNLVDADQLYCKVDYARACNMDSRQTSIFLRLRPVWGKEGVEEDREEKPERAPIEDDIEELARRKFGF